MGLYDDPVTKQAVERKMRQFTDALGPADMRGLRDGTARLAIVPEANDQRPHPAAVQLAAAIDSGDAADLATAIITMRSHGWTDLAADIASAFATRVLQRGDSDSPRCDTCGHSLEFHTPELGCWLCVCTDGDGH